MKLNEISNNQNKKSADEIETEDGWGTILKTIHLAPMENMEETMFKVELENGETGFYTQSGERVKEPHRVITKNKRRANET